MRLPAAPEVPPGVPLAAAPSRRRALALVGAALLAACAPAPEPETQKPAVARSRLSILITDAVDPALGPAKVLVDGDLVGELDRSCGVVVDVPVGERLVEVVWADRRISGPTRVAPGKTAYYEIDEALAIRPAAPPENAIGPSCSF